MTVCLCLTVRSCPSLGYFQFKLNLRPQGLLFPYRLEVWQNTNTPYFAFDMRLLPYKCTKPPFYDYFYFSNAAVCSFVLDKTSQKLHRLHSKMVWVPDLFLMFHQFTLRAFCACQESSFLSSIWLTNIGKKQQLEIKNAPTTYKKRLNVIKSMGSISWSYKYLH